MLKKLVKAGTAILAAAVLFLSAMFFTDYSRVSSLKEPIFAKPEAATGTMSTTAKGIGYRVDIKYHFDEDGNRGIEQIGMYAFGKLIFAAIT